MNILDRIVADIRKDLHFKKQIFPVSYWESSPLFARPVYSLSQSVRKSAVGIIAEHKRRSPSKQAINLDLRVSDVAMGYESAKVSGMSVLTNLQYFGGSLDDLLQARSVCELPLLRKEFIVDEYQIIEAKAFGADAILLIAACLTRAEIKQLSDFAHQLELEVLLEVHCEAELQKALMPSLDLLGVNNRDLTTFSVSLETSKQLVDQIPDEMVKISESGISTITAVHELQAVGFDGFLMGEHFMRSEHPGTSAQYFIDHI